MLAVQGNPAHWRLVMRTRPRRFSAPVSAASNGSTLADIRNSAAISHQVMVAASVRNTSCRTPAGAVSKAAAGRSHFSWLIARLREPCAPRDVRNRCQKTEAEPAAGMVSDTDPVAASFAQHQSHSFARPAHEGSPPSVALFPASACPPWSSSLAWLMEERRPCWWR